MYVMALNKQFIDGEWRDGKSATVYEMTNPYNNQVIDRVKLANKEDIDEAYRAAQRAQAEWAKVPAEKKRSIILKAADILERRQKEAIDFLVKETGSTVIKSTMEVQATIDLIKETANWPDKVGVRQVFPSADPTKENLVFREPAGVVGIISPWNWPLFLSVRAVAPAVAVGDAVVLKPDLQSQITGGFLIAEIYEEAGLPKGVLNVITADIPEIGDAFIEHPIPRIISFTGSTAVGRHIGEVAGRNLKRVALELGGNSPLVILEDADLDAAVDAAIFGKYIHQGQICMITNRILVHRKHYDEFVKRFVERAKQIPYGDPADPNVIIGPIINERQIEKILGFVELGKSEGAKLVLEGQRIGNVLTPFVFADVKNDSQLAQSEIFGPVATIIPFDTDEEGIRLANETEYGLSAAVFTKDLEHGVDIARRLESGMAHVNDQTVNITPETPFGGEKFSGLGRYGGEFAFEEFTTVKWVSVQKERRQFPF
jgi:acyl-CoA reductase-like NAD-dependent aldehyde dehydrogenase